MTIEMTEAIARVRVKAAALIRERGWCQAMASNYEGCICLGNAIRTASGRTISQETCGGASQRLLGPCKLNDPRRGFSGVGSESWTVWNDTAGRTVDDVLMLLEGDTP